MLQRIGSDVDRLVGSVSPVLKQAYTQILQATFHKKKGFQKEKYSTHHSEAYRLLLFSLLAYSTTDASHITILSTAEGNFLYN